MKLRVNAVMTHDVQHTMRELHVDGEVQQHPVPAYVGGIPVPATVNVHGDLLDDAGKDIGDVIFNAKPDEFVEGGVYDISFAPAEAT